MSNNENIYFMLIGSANNRGYAAVVRSTVQKDSDVFTDN